MAFSEAAAKPEDNDTADMRSAYSVINVFSGDIGMPLRKCHFHLQ